MPQSRRQVWGFSTRDEQRQKAKIFELWGKQGETIPWLFSVNEGLGEKRQSTGLVSLSPFKLGRYQNIKVEFCFKPPFANDYFLHDNEMDLVGLD